MPAAVPTVKGYIPVAELGTTLMHEHVFILNSEIHENYPSEWDEDEQVANAVLKLNALKQFGVDTIVDPTVIGLGRNIPRIQRVASQTDVNIVVATGLYTYGDLPFYFTYRRRSNTLENVDVMTEMFVGDVRDGIAGTGVRAGVIKCATDEPGLTLGVERVLRAAAGAHRLTGVPITTHTHAKSRRGLDQQRVFLEEGVDLSRVIIGHSGDTTDLDYLKELMANGSYIGMDRFGLYVETSFVDRVDTVAELCREGYARYMVLSQDSCCFIDWFDQAVRQVFLPEWSYTHISEAVLPALRQRAVTEDQIHTMMVDNPRRIFEITTTY